MAKAKVATEWKPLVMRKSKARLIERIFITNGLQRSGYYQDMAEAEAECARLNKQATPRTRDRSFLLADEHGSRR